MHITFTFFFFCTGDLLFAKVQKLHSGSACHLLRREDIIYEELNAVVLYVVIFVPSQFWLASVLLTPVLVRHTARNQCMIRRPGCEDDIFVSMVAFSNCTISYDLQQLRWLNFS